MSSEPGFELPDGRRISDVAYQAILWHVFPNDSERMFFTVDSYDRELNEEEAGRLAHMREQLDEYLRRITDEEIERIYDEYMEDEG